MLEAEVTLFGLRFAHGEVQTVGCYIGLLLRNLHEFTIIQKPHSLRCIRISNPVQAWEFQERLLKLATFGAATLGGLRLFKVRTVLLSWVAVKEFS